MGYNNVYLDGASSLSALDAGIGGMAGDVTFMARFRQDEGAEDEEMLVSKENLLSGSYLTTRQFYRYYGAAGLSLDSGITYLFDLPNKGEWTHMAGRFNDDAANSYSDFFVNGILVATTTGATGLATPDSGWNLFVGTSSPLTTITDLQAEVAEWGVYNRALFNDEMSYNYQHPNNPITRGLLAAYTQDSWGKTSIGAPAVSHGLHWPPKRLSASIATFGSALPAGTPKLIPTHKIA